MKKYINKYTLTWAAYLIAASIALYLLYWYG